MRVVVQRAASGSVRVGGEVVGAFDGPGLVVLVGVTHTDTADTAATLAARVYGLRIFAHRHARDVTCIPPGAGREVSAQDLGLPVLVVSQFTLYGDTRKGRRPSWTDAAPGPIAEPLVDAFASTLEGLGAQVSRGVFGADMHVSLTNDGPMTLVLEA